MKTAYYGDTQDANVAGVARLVSL
uniref:Uncharacterized protein n=1 Tax=Anguilla anguilla TaxID=7936 RepID=A0A0E9QYI7_ANGAN